MEHERRFGPIFCTEEWLREIQTTGLFPDSKTFVDMTLSGDPETADTELRNLIKAGKKPNKEFIEKYFTGPGNGTKSVTAEDWVEKPAILEQYKSKKELHEWILHLNETWRTLCRKITHTDEKNTHTSLLPLPHPFIVPGERFREVYYWDSYWTIGGLLACGMNCTVRGMLENFLHLVDKFGFVPNGGRTYYLNRSQPPLLTPMVDLFFQETGKTEFLKEYLPLLRKENDFWLKHRTVEVQHNGTTYKMARYCVDNPLPRPEGYVEDAGAASGMSDSEAKTLYHEIASAAESGWDFSSRWFGDRASLSTIKTSRIIPVDLNVFLFWAESILAKFHGILGDDERAAHYEEQAKCRATAVHSLMWDAKLGSWFDYDLDQSADQQRRDFYPSNLFPLFAGCHTLNLNDDRVSERILGYLADHLYDGQVPTSPLETGQQWDFPNAWPPLVHLTIKSVKVIPSDPAQQLAKTLAMTWLKRNQDAWRSTGHMYEKYDVRGGAGSGGEYGVQRGFGWSNGTVLMLLSEFADSIL